MPSLLFSANKSRQYYTRYRSTSEFLIEYSFLFHIVQIPFSIDLFFVRKKKKNTPPINRGSKRFCVGKKITEKGGGRVEAARVDTRMHTQVNRPQGLHVCAAPGAALPCTLNYRSFRSGPCTLALFSLFHSVPHRVTATFAPCALSTIRRLRFSIPFLFFFSSPPQRFTILSIRLFNRCWRRWFTFHKSVPTEIICNTFRIN